MVSAIKLDLRSIRFRCARDVYAKSVRFGGNYLIPAVQPKIFAGRNRLVLRRRKIEPLRRGPVRPVQLHVGAVGGRRPLHVQHLGVVEGRAHPVAVAVGDDRPALGHCAVGRVLLHAGAVRARSASRVEDLAGADVGDLVVAGLLVEREPERLGVGHVRLVDLDPGGVGHRSAGDVEDLAAVEARRDDVGPVRHRALPGGGLKGERLGSVRRGRPRLGVGAGGRPVEVEGEAVRLANQGIGPVTVVADRPFLGVAAPARPLLHVGARQHAAVGDVEDLAGPQVGDGVEPIGAELEAEPLGRRAVGVGKLHVGAVARPRHGEGLRGVGLSEYRVNAIINSATTLNIGGRIIYCPLLRCSAVFHVKRNPCTLRRRSARNI